MNSIAACRSVDHYTRLNKIAEGTYGKLSLFDNQASFTEDKKKRQWKLLHSKR